MTPARQSPLFLLSQAYRAARRKLEGWAGFVRIASLRVLVRLILIWTFKFVLTNKMVYRMICTSAHRDRSLNGEETLQSPSMSRVAAASRPRGPANAGLDVLRDSGQAAVLLYHPLRLRILAALLEPDSATGVARRMNLPRQTVNYHVRELARARLLTQAGRRRRRRLYEQCYVATARGYVLSPELLGKLAADPAQVADTLSANYLLGLASKIQSELGRASQLAVKAGKRLATLSINTELRFTSPEQRAAFTEDLQRAVVEVVGRHSSPYRKDDGSAGQGRPFRLVLGCYPMPKDPENSPLKKSEKEDVP
jgi:DNA-binding transcriptional ArsR family regulator